MTQSIDRHGTPASPAPPELESDAAEGLEAIDRLNDAEARIRTMMTQQAIAESKDLTSTGASTRDGQREQDRKVKTEARYDPRKKRIEFKLKVETKPTSSPPSAPPARLTNNARIAGLEPGLSNPDARVARPGGPAAPDRGG